MTAEDVDADEARRQYSARQYLKTRSSSKPYAPRSVAGRKVRDAGLGPRVPDVYEILASQDSRCAACRESIVSLDDVRAAHEDFQGEVVCRACSSLISLDQMTAARAYALWVYLRTRS